LSWPANELLFRSSRGFPSNNADEAEELSVVPEERVKLDVMEWAYEEVDEAET
jgi:hypothetical protein